LAPYLSPAGGVGGVCVARSGSFINVTHRDGRLWQHACVVCTARGEEGVRAERQAG
jgi:hypothetical protein